MTRKETDEDYSRPLCLSGMLNTCLNAIAQKIFYHAYL